MTTFELIDLVPENWHRKEGQPEKSVLLPLERIESLNKMLANGKKPVAFRVKAKNFQDLVPGKPCAHNDTLLWLEIDFE